MVRLQRQHGVGAVEQKAEPDRAVVEHLGGQDLLRLQAERAVITAASRAASGVLNVSAAGAAKASRWPALADAHQTDAALLHDPRGAGHPG
jgi:hypothetical protein